MPKYTLDEIQKLPKRIMHYGLQRSGTNFLAELFEKNFGFPIINGKGYGDGANPGQKHFRLYDDKNKISEQDHLNTLVVSKIDDIDRELFFVPHLYIIISKHPYAWYFSYMKYALPYWQNNHPNWRKISHHPLEEYNLFYNHWLNLSQKSNNILLIKYVDLLQKPIEILDNIANKLNITLSHYITSLSTINMSPYIFDIPKYNYYVNKEYLKDSYKLKKYVDMEISQRLGYTEFE